MDPIRDRVIVVTGSSSGIGACAAQSLAARGAIVCLVARREDELAKVRKAIEDDGGRAFIYPTDLAKDEQIDATAKAILEQHERVDVLVNNAGRSIRRMVHESFDREHDYQRLMQVNYLAAVRMTLRFLPGMLERKDGHIVNVSSMGVQIGTPRFSAYIASKSALEGFSRSLAAEMADRGVAVTRVRYPLVKTPMSAPTPIYRKVPQMSPEQAGEWIVHAIEKRRATVGRPGGTLLEAMHVLFPTRSALWTGRSLRWIDHWLRGRIAKEEMAAESAANDLAEADAETETATETEPPVKKKRKR